MKQQTIYACLLILLNTAVSSSAQNTKFGTYALFSLTNGFDNSAFGYESLKDNTTGYENSAFGDAAMKNNTDGNSNSAFGCSALRDNSIGGSNAAFGNRALTNNTIGNINTGIGSWALINNTTGSSNTAVGGSALWYNQGGNNNTAVGNWSLAGTYTLNNASNNSSLGHWCLRSNTANDNNGFGYYTMSNNTTGTANSAFGSSSMYLNVSGSNNAAFGNNSLYNNKGSQNCAFGFNAAYFNNLGYNLNAFGMGAAYSNNSGVNNSAMGSNSLYYNASGHSNTGIGNYALRYARYSNNVGLGVLAGNDSDLSNDCTYLGYNANNDSYLHLYSNSTVIGSGSRMTASNQVVLGNSSVATIGGFANWTNFSDGRFKKEVNEDVPGLEFIKKLRPVTYHVDAHGLAAYLNEDVVDAREGTKRDAENNLLEKARSAKESQLETGFIAQEVEAAAASLDYDFSGVDKPQNETDLYGLRYAAFTVPLVKAVQELDQENMALKTQYAELQIKTNEILKQNTALLKRLEALEASMTARTATEMETFEQTATLQQNIPNPFSQETIINFSVPENARQVSLLFSSETGAVVKELAIAERGAVSIQVPGKSLMPGTYFYTLLVDGQRVDTKKMILGK